MCKKLLEAECRDFIQSFQDFAELFSQYGHIDKYCGHIMDTDMCKHWLIVQSDLQKQNVDWVPPKEKP